ncbi:hypothetical protein EJ08DRAFT_695969 [Tothia fuscella]|uniref:Uncharacterized protein n=1 Tax=Tothia fuscella TaxID=1048955 RepID=A0A9P4NVC1_9PEZI|nr:hypothetical protein EJ08DRAFT_695969 [Tothia fuscella]
MKFTRRTPKPSRPVEMEHLSNAVAVPRQCVCPEKVPKRSNFFSKFYAVLTPSISSSSLPTKSESNKSPPPQTPGIPKPNASKAHAARSQDTDPEQYSKPMKLKGLPKVPRFSLTDAIASVLLQSEPFHARDPAWIAEPAYLVASIYEYVPPSSRIAHGPGWICGASLPHPSCSFNSIPPVSFKDDQLMGGRVPESTSSPEFAFHTEPQHTCSPPSSTPDVINIHQYAEGQVRIVPSSPKASSTPTKQHRSSSGDSSADQLSDGSTLLTELETLSSADSSLLAAVADTTFDTKEPKNALRRKGSVRRPSCSAATFTPPKGHSVPTTHFD